MIKGKKQKDLNIPNINSLTIIFSLSFAKERDYFIENIAILLTSGLDLLSVLDAMNSEFKSKGMREVTKYIKESVEDGIALWAALKPIHIVPDYVISLIKIGEESGRLPENFKVIVSQRKKEQALKSKIQSAMAYPILVLALSVIILLGITWFILPSLSGVYSRLGIELPLLTVILINIGNFMGKYGAIVTPILLLIIISTVYVIFFSPKTKFIGQMILFKTPLISKYVKEIELSRFGFYIGTLMEAGVPVADTLNSIIGIGGFAPFLKFYKYLYEKIIEGYTFERAFLEFKNIEKYIPSVTQNMIKSGEKSGNLPEVLQTIGEIYESRTESSTKNLSSILEPALLIVVWFGVAGIALGIVLPIYSLIGNISNFSSGTTNNVSNSNSPVISTTPISITTTPPIIPTGNTAKISITPIVSITPSAQTKLSLTVISNSLIKINIRDKPSLSGKILGQVSNGEKYYYISSQSGWYQIILNDNSIAWINSQYIKLNP